MALDIVQLLELTSWRAFDVADDGRVLAGSDASGTVQLIELTDDGKQATLTALPGSVSGRYLPGERVVIVQHDCDGDERAQLSLLHLDEADAPARLGDLRPLVHDPRYVHRLLDVLPGRIVYATNRRNGVDFDVVIRSVVTGEEEIVYDQGGMVMEVSVAPDSRYVALTLPAQHSTAEQIILVNTLPMTEADKVVALTDAELPARHSHIGWRPDDTGLIVTTDADRDFTSIVRFDPRTGTRLDLVTSDEHDLTGWLSPDGSALLVHANEDGVSRLTLHDAVTGELRRLVELPGDGWCSYPQPPPVWSPNSAFVALSFSSPTTPGDVLLLDAGTGRCRALTSSAAAVLDGTGAENALTEPSTHRVPTRDGRRVPCFRYAPADADPARAASAVLVIHGGPESQAVRSFNPVVQALAAQGHTVLVPNVRGSTGYGKSWYSADDGPLRMEAVADLADLHDWLPTIGLDPGRAALWGGSYGGYMVLAGLAFQPRRWAAGVDIVGISSLVTFLENTAGYRRAHREREYGSLATDAGFLRAASPLTEVDAIAAPLFVLHGANDPRVPVSEAEQVVAAVRAKGLDCELRVYDDEGHGLSKRVNRIDAYSRALEFLTRHLTKQ